jgi:hypothetical protein
MAEQLVYGWLRGGHVSQPAPIGASEVFKKQSGQFVTNDGSGRAEVAADGTTALWGHMEAEEFTASATEGADVRNMIVDPSAVFRIPVNSGTYVVGMLGETCDLSVISGVQGVQLDASAEDTVRIVGGDAVNNFFVELMFVDAKRYNVGVV